MATTGVDPANAASPAAAASYAVEVPPGLASGPAFVQNIESTLIDLQNQISANDLSRTQGYQFLSELISNHPSIQAISIIIDEKIKTAVGLSKGGGNQWFKPILESKAVSDLPKIADSKGYREWNRQLKNALEQIKPNARKVFAFVEQISEAQIADYKRHNINDAAFECVMDIYDNQGNQYKAKYPDIEEELEKMNRDLWSILVAKAKDEAWEKISGVQQGEGLWAYIRMHRWFKQTTEQGMINRRTSIMDPDPIKQDHMLASGIERWEERYRSLVEEEKEDELPERYRMAALRKMLTGDIKKHVDLEISKIKTYQDLRSTIMNWAVDRKLEKERKDEDLGEIDDDFSWEKTDQGHSDESWGLYQVMAELMGGNEDEINMIGKGKGKGKSKGKAGGKGKGSSDAIRAMILQIMRNKGSGKGGWNPTAVGCNKCGKAGHLARDCTSKIELRKCAKCGKVGHLAAVCRSEPANGVEEDQDEENSGLSHVELGWGGMFSVEEIMGVGDSMGCPPCGPATNPCKTQCKGQCEHKETPSWEILENATGSENVSWRKKIVGGHKITFVLDSGAARTIAPRNMIPNVNPYKTKNTGKMFRVANGEQIPNEGELDLKGRASNGEKLRIKSQVANITRPLAATSEMVDAGNLVIMNKSGGLIKQLSEEDQAKVTKMIENASGPAVPVTRKGNAFHVEIEVKSEEH